MKVSFVDHSGSDETFYRNNIPIRAGWADSISVARRDYFVAYLPDGIFVIPSEAAKDFEVEPLGPFNTAAKAIKIMLVLNRMES